MTLKISVNNRIAVDQSGTWRFNYGLRPPTDNTETWSNFSVCNLRTGDRVVVSYMGGPEDLVFSSAGNSTTYNGCAAFVDKWNDGVYHDNGQVPEDQYISGGMPVQIDWQRNEGKAFMLSLLVLFLLIMELNGATSLKSISCITLKHM